MIKYCLLQEHYLLTGAMQHPGGSGGLRLLLRKVGITYASILACFLNDVAMQVTGAYTYVRFFSRGKSADILWSIVLTVC